ncbi:MAG TPA: NAD-dependent epimerase/dehydratase family protein [Ktedonobacteraceae bacterium]|nr:NAD-dependent epimerase/dehydratase family protein [Ktedonobacteraceae bacterium]
MEVLITGATGLLGGHLIKELQQRNEHIRALVLPVENADKLTAQGVEVVRGDITDPSTLEPAVQGVDLIFHLAGMMGVWRPLSDYRLVNVTGSEYLYKAAQKAGVRRFVHTSSHTVYGLGHGRYMKETDPLRPDPDPYSITKAEGDRLIRRLMLTSEMETVILRPGTFFGPGDHLHFGRMAQKVKDGKGLILGRGDNALPFCYVTDVVQGYMLAGYHEKAPGNVYNITNDRPLTQREMFDAIADAVGGKRPTLHLPYLPVYWGATVAENLYKLAHLKMKPPATQLGALMFGSDNKHSIEKARKELGYEPKVPLREGIKLAAEWFNAGGMQQAPITQASQNAPLAGARK